MEKTAKIFNFVRQDEWRHLRRFVGAFPLLSQMLEEDLKVTAAFEKQSDMHVAGTHVGGSPLIQEGILKIKSTLVSSFTFTAKEGLVSKDLCTDDRLAWYEKAMVTSPYNIMAIQGAVECYQELGQVDEASELLVHLAIMARYANDFNLAKYVLAQDEVDDVFLKMEPKVEAKQDNAPASVTYLQNFRI